ncbi:MAG: hypothetical protein K6L80_00625 [Agarilytica sp.]
MKNFSLVLSVLFLVSIMSGCASTSSSSIAYLPEEERYVGQVYLVMSPVPEEIGYEIIGHVKANARQGYDRVETLYPLIAEEARKVGANAVINVRGGRTVAAFSWAAPFAGGIAIRIDDPDKLIKYGRQSH